MLYIDVARLFVGRISVASNVGIVYLQELVSTEGSPQTTVKLLARPGSTMMTELMSTCTDIDPAHRPWRLGFPTLTVAFMTVVPAAVLAATICGCNSKRLLCSGEIARTTPADLHHALAHRQRIDRLVCWGVVDAIADRCWGCGSVALLANVNRVTRVLVLVWR